MIERVICPYCNTFTIKTICSCCRESRKLNVIDEDYIKSIFPRQEITKTEIYSDRFDVYVRHNKNTSLYSDISDDVYSKGWRVSYFGFQNDGTIRVLFVKI